MIFLFTGSHYVAAILDTTTNIIHTFCLMTKRVPGHWAKESQLILEKYGYEFPPLYSLPFWFVRYKLVAFQSLPSQVGCNVCTVLCADVVEIALPQLLNGVEIEKLDFSAMNGKVVRVSYHLIHYLRLTTSGSEARKSAFMNCFFVTTTV